MQHESTQQAQLTAYVAPTASLRRRLDLLLRTGQLLVQSNADTNRILRTLKRVAAFLGLPEKELHVHVQYDMLQVNLSDELHSFTKFQRCEKHAINMQIIQDISKLTWKAISQDYDIEQYSHELERIATAKPHYSHWLIAICAGFACGGFCIQFGCDWTAFFYASIAAIVGNRLRMWLNQIGSNHLANIAIAAFVSTLVAWLTHFISLPQVADALPLPLRHMLCSNTPWHPLMACALYIIPGVPLINFVSDMLDSRISTGLIRATNTMLMIMAMSAGITIAIKVLGIDSFFSTMSLIPKHTFAEYALASAISAMGFATIFNVPPRLMPWIAIGGIIAVCSRNYITLGPSMGHIGLDWGPLAGALCGSAIISIINIRMVHLFHTPHQCITIPAVIPMVPGVLMYRALYSIIGMQGVAEEVTGFTQNAINGSLILIAIALGVAIPNVFFQKWIAPKRQKKLNAMIHERKQRGKFIDLSEYTTL